ncbi:MAG: hypothetical protein CMH48_06920 [Muricauda sp.]|nr:hypothetical protein [Allomuricauda sp.]
MGKRQVRNDWNSVILGEPKTDPVLAKKILPLEEGDYYLSEEGYKVFTEQYLLKRGYCCESGCRHCPYGFDKKTGLRR